MIDREGRDIRYLRLSVTDRCNLRCRYCMPDGVEPVSHGEILRYEEFLRLTRLFVRLGIDHVRVTGGEPLVRKGVVDFIDDLRHIDGIRKISLTTNGVLLADHAEALHKAGLSAVNISLDTADEACAERLTGHAGVTSAVLQGMDAMKQAGIPVKLNAVLLRDTAEGLPGLVRLADSRGVPLRLIELMPLGCAGGMEGLPAPEALTILKMTWPDLHPTDLRLGSGPARYYESRDLSIPVGIIDAVSDRFCSSCNRVRLTSTGVLKPCLCYEGGVPLGTLMREGAGDDELLERIRDGIRKKPRQHCFDTPHDITEARLMSQIGG